ncbi:hypothetical protein NQ314_000127 [Rhamnusium bicolor]|uniref:Uncharacterized protein n=1 Tax=Rhamnusium bicolor TaxID=1586634 RepID=A0AAV8ZY87_9CUCU|nr:hypothetical protein NQ314_000127 [Rhamnusium bicolor]
MLDNFCEGSIIVPQNIVARVASCLMKNANGRVITIVFEPPILSVNPEVTAAASVPFSFIEKTICCTILEILKFAFFAAPVKKISLVA